MGVRDLLRRVFGFGSSGSGAQAYPDAPLTALLHADRINDTAATEQAIDDFLPQCTLGFRIVNAPATLQPGKGTYTTKPGDNMKLGMINGPNGEIMLLAYADPELWIPKRPDLLPLAGLTGLLACQMIRDQNHDGLWINVLPDFSYLIHKERILKILEHANADSGQQKA